MTQTLSGHDAITSSSDPRLASALIPGTKRVRITTRRGCLPLFVDCLRRLNVQVKPLGWDTWSYAYRPPRAGSGISDHAGYAVDCWSGTIGANTWPTNMSRDEARAMSKVLEHYKIDGKHIFGWGVYNGSPGVTYTGPVYHSTRYNDPMHVFIAPGVNMTMCRRLAHQMGLKADGTRVETK